MKLNTLAFGLTIGILWGIGLFLATWWIILFDGASMNPTFIGSIYRGYNITPLGSVIGLVWAAIDGFVGGVILAWLYNLLSSRMGQAN